jgi:hypothetical protein
MRRTKLIFKSTIKLPKELKKVVIKHVNRLQLRNQLWN